MRCKYCKEEKPNGQFEVAKTTPDKVYRRLRCKSCKQALQNKRRRKIYDWLCDLKRTFKCSVCAFSDWRALDFHHVDPALKDRAVACLITFSKKRILLEIEKCTVLCANCHRIRHSNHPFVA